MPRLGWDTYDWRVRNVSQLALTFVLLLQNPATQPVLPPQPRRDVPDPGTIATEQRVSPAGVQSVFTDRVFGVRFGKPGEIWVTVHGAAYRLAWHDNVVRASAAFDGRSGVQGIAIDPVNGRALFSTVGRLPQVLAQSRTPGSDEMAATNTVTRLTVLVAAISSDPGVRLCASTWGRRPTVLNSARPFTGSIAMPWTPERPSNAALARTTLSCQARR